MDNSDGDSKKDKSTKQSFPVMGLIMPLIGVVIGALLTVFLTGIINNELWLKQNISSQKKVLIEKRIGLIEKASKLLNSRQTIEDVNFYLKAQSNFATESSNCAKNSREYEMTILECKQLMNLDGIFEKMSIKSDLNTEFSTLMQLSSLYFGDKTQKYSTDLSKLKEWWLADKEIFVKYIAAMHDELYKFEYQ